MWKNKHVHDLAWLLEGPNLLGDPGKALRNVWVSQERNSLWNTQHLQWLEEIDRNPSDLNDFMAGNELMLLGKHYERLFHYWMSRSPHFELIDHNIQIQGETRTSTEIDFIAKYLPEDLLIHFEISCKYYLAAANSSIHSKWVGPNGQDNLELRMKKFEKQLSFFNSESGKAVLKVHNWSQPTALGWLKGYFFIPFEMLGRHVSPKGAGKHYSAGWYMKEKEALVLAGSPDQWMILQRHDWISPWKKLNSSLVPEILNGRNLVERITAHFQLSQKAMLIIQLNPLDQYESELSRGFIVSNRWPESV